MQKPRGIKQPKGTRRQVQKAETRALILESARTLFSTQEYDRVTIRGVATHAGIGLGTIYKHFPNKLSLLAAALRFLRFCLRRTRSNSRLRLCVK